MGGVVAPKLLGESAMRLWMHTQEHKTHITSLVAHSHIKIGTVMMPRVVSVLIIFVVNRKKMNTTMTI
jgi:hypothetical protein